MVRKADRYTFRVMWSEDDDEFIGLCAEFPSLSWLAESPGAALKGIRSVVQKCMKDLESTGEDVPPAIATRNYSGKFMVRVPPEVHRQLAIKAAESGVSLNRVASSMLAR
jgi:predicted HicB family RNase H-like nuclease